MSTTEVEVYTPRERAPLPAKVQYAKLLADSGLLPAAYRRNPANVLYAVEYGDMLGLSPMAAITGIHIIEGKPSASAGLISGLVRQAGHKLRVRGDNRSATCQIIRSDDPEHPFEVTFTMADAQTAGLTHKDVWKKYPASMLKSRAVTQCARDACEEVLFGLHYTPEELGAEVDGDGNVVGEIASDPAPAGQAPAGNGMRIEYGPGGTLVVDPECLVAPEGDPWTVREAPEDWTDKTIALVPSLTDTAEAGKLYKEAVAKRDAGEITKAQQERICVLITARVEELSASPVEGTVAAPDGDPWQAEIDSMSTREDAEPLLGKLEQQYKGGVVDSRRYKGLKAAIRTKADTLPSAPGEAA